MKNYVHKGENITVPAPVGIVLGAPIPNDSLFGIANGDAKTDSDLDLVAVGAFTLAKVAAFAIAISNKLYFNAATGLVNKTSAGNGLVGGKVTAAPNPSGFIKNDSF